MPASNKVFIVDDDFATRRLMEMTVGRAWGYDVRVFSNGQECLDEIESTPDVVLLDIMMAGMNGVEVLRLIKERSPSSAVIMLSAQGNINVAVETMKLGAEDYFTKPVDFKRLQFALEKALKVRFLERRVQRLQETLEQASSIEGIIAHDGSMREVLRLVGKAKDSDISVLIQGESGTGKEVIARAIHFNGKRREQPFVVINCAAIPRELLESELFGHERGAFTGAVERKTGRFEQADGGTIFLDEIGEMDPALQAKLLRVLQQREFERVGGTHTISVDVRILSATHRDLRGMVDEGQFREDLFYRLNSFPILLPPLRERHTDILVLAQHFLDAACEREQRPALQLAPETAEKLRNYSWPGNIRELQSAIERAVLLNEHPDELRPEALPHWMPSVAANPQTGAADAPVINASDEVLPLEEVKKQALLRALQHTSWNVKEAARLLGIGRTTIYRMLDEYGIDSTPATL